MDLQHVLFSAEGRIGRQDFWVGWLILFFGGWMLHLLPVIGTLIWLVSIYCWVVLYAKRLHDFGRSGWWALIPVASNAIGFALVLGLIVVAVVALVAGHAAYADTTGWWAAGPVLGGAAGVAAIAGVLCVVHLLFLLWVGLTPGTPGRNRYGDPCTEDGARAPGYYPPPSSAVAP